MNYARQSEVVVKVPAAAADVFALLDDQEALGAHMTMGSAMMVGGQMRYEFDQDRGRTVGSVILMSGRILGFSISVEEVVTERSPPWRKVLETRGPQKMLVIDSYRLGFEIEAIASQSAVRFFIDYNLPPGPIGVLAAVPAHFYARWCISSMAAALERFSPQST